MILLKIPHQILTKLAKIRAQMVQIWTINKILMAQIPMLILLPQNIPLAAHQPRLQRLAAHLPRHSRLAAQ
jgi:hypothetical protein